MQSSAELLGYKANRGEHPSLLYASCSSRILYYRRRKNLLGYMKRIITSDNT